MKLYGIEATFTPTEPGATRDSLCDTLDTLHDALTADDNIYSADMVAEGASEVSLLIGIRVEDDEDGSTAAKHGLAAMCTAFSAAEISDETWQTLKFTTARALAAVVA